MINREPVEATMGRRAETEMAAAKVSTGGERVVCQAAVKRPQLAKPTTLRTSGDLQVGIRRLIALLVQTYQ